jgi:hypothetical protein
MAERQTLLKALEKHGETGRKQLPNSESPRDPVAKTQDIRSISGSPPANLQGHDAAKRGMLPQLP